MSRLTTVNSNYFETSNLNGTVVFVDMKKERTHYDRAFKENAIKLSFERKNNF